MKMILALALVAGLSACASFSARPPAEASIANATDRAVRAEAGYSDAAEFAALSAPALKASDAAIGAEFDRKAFLALSAARLTYPAPATMSDADRIRLSAAVTRSDRAHDALQAALARPG